VINSVLNKVFGTSNERAVKRMLPVLAQINAHEESLQSLTDEQLTAKTFEFKNKSSPPKRPSSTTSSPRPSPSSARPASASSACATSTSR
jgi:preprotein translocase subunit SecA